MIYWHPLNRSHSACNQSWTLGTPSSDRGLARWGRYSHDPLIWQADDSCGHRWEEKIGSWERYRSEKKPRGSLKKTKGSCLKTFVETNTASEVNPLAATEVSGMPTKFVCFHHFIHLIYRCPESPTHYIWQKTRANRKEASKLRTHSHQFDIMRAVNTHNTTRETAQMLSFCCSFHRWMSFLN